MSWSAVAQIESGRRTNLRPATLAALARALGVTIDYLVHGGPAGDVMLNHCALPYSRDDEFVEVVGAFVKEAIARSEPVLAVITKANRRALEACLGPEADQVEFCDRASWYRAPADALKRYSAFLNEKLDAGASWVRIIGEPTWPAKSESRLQLWTRYESLLNLAFSSAPVTVLCPYDTRKLDPEIVRHAYVTHPHTIERGRFADSADSAEPGDFLQG